MLSSRLFRKSIFLLLIVIFLYILAEIFYLHWAVWWYDVVLHFLSGICASMAFMYFYFQYFQFSFENKVKAIYLSFFFVLAVGIIWEIYEIQFDHASFSDGVTYLRDTISDLIADVCGGFFGTIYSFRFFPKINDKIDLNGK